MNDADNNGENQQDDWWQFQCGCGAGTPSALFVLMLTAERMASFREGGYEENLLPGCLGVLPSALDDNQLTAVTSAGDDAYQKVEEKCGQLEESGSGYESEFSGKTTATKDEALSALLVLHKVLADVGVSPLDLQRAAALT